MVNPKTGRVVSQDDWKRTQVRMPHEQYDMIVEYAQNKDISLNSAMLELMDNGLTLMKKQELPANLRIIRLDNGIKRVIYGTLVNRFDIDYNNPNLSELRDDIDYCINILANTQSLKTMMMFFNKEIIVYQGGHHIDVVDNGKGSLGWLTIEDHLI